MRIAAILSGISQGLAYGWQERPRIFNNPILLRELVSQLRKKQSFFFLFAFVIVGSISFVVWWQEYLENLSSFYYTPNSRDFIEYVSILEGLVLLIAAPLFSATAINLERERDTWDLLRTTPVSMGSILVGKYLSSIFFVWIVMVSMIPIFALTLPVGGISPMEILAIFGIFTEIMILISVMGLYCSLCWKKTLQSISYTYLLGFIYFVALPLLTLIFGNRPGFLLMSTPVVLLTHVFHPSELGNTFGMSSLTVLFGHFFLVVATMGLLVALCFWQMISFRIRERVEGILKRWLNGLVQVLSKGSMLAILSLILWGGYVGSVFLSGSPLVDSQNFLFEQLFAIVGMGILLGFPLACTIHFQGLWKSLSGKEWDASPRSLHRFFWQSVKRPLMIYGQWIAVLSPVLILFVWLKDAPILSSLWVLFFLGETVLYVAAISMASCLLVPNLLLSIFYSYLISAVVLFFLPQFASFFAVSFSFVISPLMIAVSAYMQEGWRASSAALFGEHPMGILVAHGIFSVYFLLFLLLFCERRMVRLSGLFQRESLVQWFRRTRKNQSPLIKTQGDEREIPFFSEKRNLFAEKELREYFLYRRSSTLQSLIWMFLLSAGIFIVLPVLSMQFYRILIDRGDINFSITIIVFIIPFLLVPYLAHTFRKEHDQSTWDLICTTTLTPLAIVGGKLKAGFYLFNARLVALLLPVGFFAVLFEWYRINSHSHPVQFFLVSLPILYAFALLIMAVATFVSILFRKTTSAYIVALVVAFLLHAFPLYSQMLGIRSRIFSGIVSPAYLLDMYRSTQDWWGIAFVLQVGMNGFWAILLLGLSLVWMNKSMSEK